MYVSETGKLYSSEANPHLDCDGEVQLGRAGERVWLHGRQQALLGDTDGAMKLLNWRNTPTASQCRCAIVDYNLGTTDEEGLRWLREVKWDVELHMSKN